MVQVCVYVYVWVVGRVRGAAKSRGAGRPSGKQAGRQSTGRMRGGGGRGHFRWAGATNQLRERGNAAAPVLHYTSLHFS